MKECLLLKYANAYMERQLTGNEKKDEVINRMKKLNIISDIILVDVALSNVYIDYYGNDKTTHKIKDIFIPPYSAKDNPNGKNPYAKAMGYKTNRIIPYERFKRNGNILTFVLDIKTDDHKIINLQNEIIKLHNQFNI